MDFNKFCLNCQHFHSIDLKGVWARNVTLTVLWHLSSIGGIIYKSNVMNVHILVMCWCYFDQRDKNCFNDKIEIKHFYKQNLFFQGWWIYEAFFLHFQPNLACKIARNQTFEVKSSLCINRGWTKKSRQTVLFKSGSNILGQSASSVKISC